MKEDKRAGTRNIATGEAMLDIVYNNKSLCQAVNGHQWYKCTDKKEVITIKNNLSYDGFFEYLIEYEIMRNI